ncbi:MAG: gas vesicle protein GvpK [Negativicutes bacterium]
MRIDIEEGDLKQGVLGLVLALVDIIKNALKTQARLRIEGGSLSEEQEENLGAALMDLEDVLERLKADYNLQLVVDQIQQGLDDVVANLVDCLVPLGSLADEAQEEAQNEQ